MCRFFGCEPIEVLRDYVRRDPERTLFHLSDSTDNSWFSMRSYFLASKSEMLSRREIILTQPVLVRKRSVKAGKVGEHKKQDSCLFF